MINNPFSLDGKIILVTGASSGIGKEIALTLGRFGAQVIINGRNVERLEAVKAEIENDNTIVIAGDLSDEKVIDEIISKTPQLNGVVHAAGIMKLLPFKFITDGALRDMMNINFMAPVNLTLQLVKKKKLKSDSSLVYITSINGSVVGSKANAMYAGSKGALTGMIKAMAIDLAKNNIRINEIAPGMIETEGIGDIIDTVSTEAILEDIQKYPLGRYGKPADIANACIYLLSDASSWVTGSKMVIDGGFTIQ